MALIKCPECGKEISDKGQSCIHCGCPMEYIKKLIEDSSKQDIVESKSNEIIEISEYDKDKFEIENAILLKYKGKENKIIIPKGVVKISKTAFEETRNIFSITIPMTISEIEEGTFDVCRELVEVYNLSNLGISFPNEETEGSINKEVYTSLDAKSHLVYSNNCWTYNNGEKVILLLHNSDKRILHIPEGITEIYRRAFAFIEVEEVYFPKSMRIIGSGAFLYCKNLKKIELNEGLIEICPLAFDNCGQLESINIPSTLKKIGMMAFRKCSNLETFELSDNIDFIGNNAFSECEKLIIKIKEVSCFEKFEKDVFKGKDVILADGDRLKGYITEKTEVIIPTEITHVLDNAFSNTKIKKVLFNNRNTTIERNAFASSKVSIVYIDTSCFMKRGSGWWENVQIRDKSLWNRDKQDIHKQTISNVKKQEFSQHIAVNGVLEIPEGIELIEERAFSNGWFVSVKFPSTLKRIAKGAFENCRNLREITFGNNLQIIENYAFSGCDALVQCKLPNSVSKIHPYAFNGCKKLVMENLPQELNYMVVLHLRIVKI